MKNSTFSFMHNNMRWIIVVALLFTLIAFNLPSVYLQGPASFDEVNALKERADLGVEAKAKFAEMINAQPEPSREQLVEMRKVVDKLLVADLARSLKY